MPSTSNPASAEPYGPRARFGILVFAIALTAIALPGLSKISATEVRRTHVVRIEGMTYSPATLRIHPGDRVTFTNNDLVPHTATSKGTRLFDSGIIKPGESWSVTPPLEKPIRYTCTFHPTMEGEIVAIR